ncbi:MAG: MBL fold metallo-hydrolase [Planctomycetes bacterium]|nr:MBL fold metallo-hydrolase [Planctomycetota bacterium]
MAHATKIADDIYLIEQPLGETFTGITVFLGEEIALVDTGLPTAAKEEIFPLLRELGREVKDIGLVVNTHCHEDHIGSNREIQETCGARIAAHRYDVPWIEDVEQQRKDLWSLFPEQHPVDISEDKSCLNSVVNIALTDGQRIALGERVFEVIHCPGHSPGSLCLYDENDSLLLTGDSIQGQGSVDAGMAMVLDLDGYAASVKKLASRPVRCLIMDHPYRPFTDRAVLNEEQAMDLLGESARAIVRYMLTVFELLKTAPEGLMIEEVRDFLTREFGEGQSTIQAMFTTAVILRRISEQGLADCGEDGKWRPTEEALQNVEGGDFFDDDEYPPTDF